MTFDQWMDKVDRLVTAALGLSVHDLPDCCYRDWYDEGLTPRQAARRAIRNANYEE
jgi:hypothetical protein